MGVGTASSSHPSFAGQARLRLVSRVLIILGCGLLVAAALTYALAVGSQSIPVDQVIAALRDETDVKKSVLVIVREVRLPRALVGALVGLNLSVAGVMLQGVVRSPLGDPYVLGVSAGGGLAAAIALLQTDVAPGVVPIAAFAGSLIGALVVYAVAWDRSGASTVRLALAGVALTATMNAFTTTVVAMTVTVGAQAVFQWLVGGLYTAAWADFDLIWPYSAVGLAAALLLAGRANVLALGDEIAQGLGLHVEQTRFLMAAVAAVLAGSSVAVAGLVAFVGLLVPYLARRLVGSDYRFLIPASALLGAALLVAADTVARYSLPALLGQTGIEFPVGILTAVIGGPLFLWLVRERRSQW